MKPELNEYPEWFREKFGIDISGKPENIYAFVIQKLKSDVEKCDLWVTLNKNLLDYNDEYYLLHNYPLLKVSPLVLYEKSFLSLIDKTFRKNILLNDNFPEPPLNGWIIPDNWFYRIKDLLRTTITVRYLDGVEFIVNKINELAAQHSFNFAVDYEAREEGYYAAHITIIGKFKIVNDGWEELFIDFPMEILITTQLQEVIKGLLHKMYEEVRINTTTEKSKKWQWDYKSEEFSSNYLGHILHYIEGMILEVRDKQKIKYVQKS